MQNKNLAHQAKTLSLHESILVVSVRHLFQNIPTWQGLNADNFEQIVSVIEQHATYMPRPHAETDSKYKQIIPYIIFSYDKKLFVMQRKSTASEQRLASKFSLGIGGHIRQEDIQDNNIIAWADREFQEEVTFHGSSNTLTVGVLNDDSSSVGQVHLGMILLLQAHSGVISINDEHKSGKLMSLDECKAIYDHMENWSKICFDYILTHPELLA